MQYSTLITWAVMLLATFRSQRTALRSLGNRPSDHRCHSRRSSIGGSHPPDSAPYRVQCTSALRDTTPEIDPALQSVFRQDLSKTFYLFSFY